MQIDGSLSLDRSWLQVYAPATNTGSELVIGTDCVVTNTGGLYLYAGATTGSTTNGLALRVAGNVVIAPSSWIYPYSDAINGGSVFCTMRELMIAAGGGIDANAKGCADGTITHTNGFGPGGGYYGAGGGYGGQGGGGGGPTYGNSNAPTMPGSGCGFINGLTPARGAGGLIWIQARKITLNGTMTANAQDRIGYYQSGASGGGIYLRCKIWTGSGGTLTAKGGNAIAYTDGRGSAGGGGRIAVWREFDEYTGTITTNVAGGAIDPEENIIYAGQPGTIVWGFIAPAGTLFMVQ